MVSYEILATGSKGNSVIVGKTVMIDCGIAYKHVVPYVDSLKLVLLTHIHRDHFLPSTIRSLAKERPALRFAACKWLTIPLYNAGVDIKQIDLLECGETYDYGICKVQPFQLLHDVPNCGYKVHFPHGKVIYATDTSTLEGVSAKNYDLYLIEGNYGEEEIRQRIAEKIAAHQYAYEVRVTETHLSKEQCDDFVARNIGANGEYVYLHRHVEDEHDRTAEGNGQKPGRETMGDLVHDGD